MRKRLLQVAPLLAVFAFVATTEERAEAADTMPPDTIITSPLSDFLALVAALVLVIVAP